MARIIERILVWVAILIAAAALVAIAVTFLPALKLPATFDKPIAWLRAHQPGNADRPAIERAENLMAAGDTGGALKAADQAVSENPGDASIANRAGNVALRAGDQNAAERYYLAGESADRHYAWNFVALGQLYARKGDRERADAQLRAASVADPGMAFVHFDLALVELDEHLYAAALADFESELKISPDFKPAVIGRAEALERMGRRGEALALYKRAGVSSSAGKRAALKAQPLVQPSPSPTAIALASSPTPAPTVTPSKRPLKKRSGGTSITIAQSTPEPTPTPALPPWASPPAGSENGGETTPIPAPTVAPKPLRAVIADARSYLQGVGQDLNFTQALPRADPNQPTVALQSKLNAQLSKHNTDIEGALSTGSAALLSGRLEIAASAFRQVADDAPRDWRGPYLAGLTSQAQGDTGRARTWFTEALAREGRPEPYTSLAILDINDGDMAAASADARKAAAIDPTYEPGRFVAGMIDLVQANVRAAQSNLQAAIALGGAPSRTQYFVNALQQSVGEATLPPLR